MEHLGAAYVASVSADFASRLKQRYARLAGHVLLQQQGAYACRQQRQDQNQDLYANSLQRVSSGLGSLNRSRIEYTVCCPSRVEHQCLERKLDWIAERGGMALLDTRPELRVLRG